MKAKLNMAAAVFLCSALMAVTASAEGPPSTTTPTVGTSAANTSTNERDKSSATLKPTDQPNDAPDIKLAADVRKAIVNEKSLSTLAHNVKLIASNGVVTLRGPVQTSAEKAMVGQIVSGVTGVSSVDNELDIKTN